MSSLTPSPCSDQPPSPARPDVAARRAQLLDAAASVFAEHGITAPLDLVVARSGLGRATLYRHFADRTALVAGLMGRAADELEALATQLAGQPDGLFVMLRHIADGVVNSPALVDYWRGATRDEPWLAAERARSLAALQACLRTAVDAGLCRADLGPEDVSLAAGMLGAALRGRDAAERQHLAERAITLLWQGLLARPDAPSPASAPATAGAPAADSRPRQRAASAHTSKAAKPGKQNSGRP